MYRHLAVSSVNLVRNHYQNTWRSHVEKTYKLQSFTRYFIDSVILIRSELARTHNRAKASIIAITTPASNIKITIRTTTTTVTTTKEVVIVTSRSTPVPGTPVSGSPSPSPSTAIQHSSVVKPNMENLEVPSQIPPDGNSAHVDTEPHTPRSGIFHYQSDGGWQWLVNADFSFVGIYWNTIAVVAGSVMGKLILSLFYGWKRRNWGQSFSNPIIQPRLRIIKLHRTRDLQAKSSMVLAMETWSIPFGRVQAKHIIWKYKKLFPNEVLPDRIKLWPSTLAESVQKHYTAIDLEKLKAAENRHQNERQHILNEMKNLILYKKYLSTLSPLKMLEMYEDRKFCEFQAEMKTISYRFVRKHFSWLLPKRVYKPKKKSKAKIQRRHEKKRLAKSTHKPENSTNTCLGALNTAFNPKPHPWWKHWHPVQPYIVDPVPTYALSGNKSEFYRKTK